MMYTHNQVVKYKTLDDQALLKALQQKLFEELSEFDPNSKEPLRELADLQEVIDAFTYLLGADPIKLRNLQDKIRTKRGTFTKRIFVETVTLADDDPWAEYYAKDPNRFPEMKDTL